MHGLTVRLLWHESARVETDNFHTFSLVEKAHETIIRKIGMCWTQGLPWELVETKWLTNTEDCSYLPLAISDSASPKPKMNWKLIKTLERGWYQVLLTPAYDERLYFFEVNIPTKNAWSSGSRKDFNNVRQSLKCPHFLIDACVSHC